MRTLSSGLKAAQRASSGESDVYIKVGGTVYSTVLKNLRHIERPYGGVAVILLDNSDKSITDDLRGNKVTIGYGFEGEGKSDAAPLWVLTQTDVSREGQILTQLQCIDAWQRLYLRRIAAGGGVELKGTTEGSFNIGMRVTGQTSGTVGTVIAVGEGFIGVGKVAKGPFVEAEVVQSDLYSSIKITVDSVADYGGGSSPAWSGDKTILQIIEQLATGIADVVLDSSDGIVNTTKPNYTTDFNVRYLDIIEDMMNYTKSAIRMENDGKLHIFNITSAPGTDDYKYDTTHCFFSDIRDTSLVLPNRIIVINAEQILTGITPYYGEAKDDAAIARFEEVVQVVSADVRSNDAANELAASRLNRVQKETTRGTVEVPMNCGQELFDYIKVTDTRAGIAYKAWIGSLEHEWEEGVYKLTIGLGGLSGAEKLPVDEEEYPLPNMQIPIVPVISSTTWILPRAIQGFHHDIHFTATNWRTVDWSDGGTIKFYDGTTQVISGGSYAMPSDALYSVYFDLDDDNPNILKTTTDYLSVLTMKTGVICITQRSIAGADGGMLANVLPSYGKEPLITPDFIDMAGIGYYDYGGGTYIPAVFQTQVAAGRLVLSAANTFEEGYDPTTKELLVHRGAVAPDDTTKLWWDTNVDTMKRYDGENWIVYTGEWYRKSGVILDATKGIAIYGGAMSFRTYPTEADYDEDTNIQCYIDTDGKMYAGGGNVVLDADGLHILGYHQIEFKDGEDVRGWMYPTAYGIAIAADTGGNLSIGVGATYLGAGVGFATELVNAGMGKLVIPVGEDLYN